MHDCSLEFKSQIENAVILINLQSHFLFSNHDHLTFSVNGFILSQCFFFLGIIPFNSTLQNHTCNLRLFSEVIHIITKIFLISSLTCPLLLLLSQPSCSNHPICEHQYHSFFFFWSVFLGLLTLSCIAVICGCHSSH